jgi:hypothetical protein
MTKPARIDKYTNTDTQHQYMKASKVKIVSGCTTLRVTQIRSKVRQIHHVMNGIKIKERKYKQQQMFNNMYVRTVSSVRCFVNSEV